MPESIAAARPSTTAPTPARTATAAPNAFSNQLDQALASASPNPAPLAPGTPAPTTEAQAGNPAPDLAAPPPPSAAPIAADPAALTAALVPPADQAPASATGPAAKSPPGPKKSGPKSAGADDPAPTDTPAATTPAPQPGVLQPIVAPPPPAAGADTGELAPSAAPASAAPAQPANPSPAASATPPDRAPPRSAQPAATPSPQPSLASSAPTPATAPSARDDAIAAALAATSSAAPHPAIAASLPAAPPAATTAGPQSPAVALASRRETRNPIALQPDATTKSGPAATGILTAAPDPAPDAKLDSAAQLPQPQIQPAPPHTEGHQPALPASPTPAAQVAAAIVPPIRVALSAPQSATQQPHTLVIQLNPADLGQVQVRIERPDDGPARVELSASRSETLQLLTRDHAQLQQALDQAGIPAAGRILHFSLTPDQPTSPPPSPTFLSAGSGFGAGTGQETSSGNARAQPTAARGGSAAFPAIDTALHPIRWSRSGIDITA